MMVNQGDGPRQITRVWRLRWKDGLVGELVNHYSAKGMELRMCMIVVVDVFTQDVRGYLQTFF